MGKNCRVPGSFKVEWPKSEAFFSVPFRVIVLREKAYIVEAIVKQSLQDPIKLFNKVAARSSCKKLRTGKYGIDKFLELGNSVGPVFEHNLTSLRSKSFQIFQISSSRRTLSKFSRKRFVLKSGKSVPFAFYKIKKSFE